MQLHFLKNMINKMQPKEVNFTKQVNTRDFYKGTSFRWCGEWEAGKLYSNDTYFIDYVVYDNALWVCTSSHYSSEDVAPCPHSPHWQNAVAPGPQGRPGTDGRHAIHVGPNPPTRQEYGDNYKNVLWLDTDEVPSDYSNVINILVDRVNELEQRVTALERSK